MRVSKKQLVNQIFAKLKNKDKQFVLGEAGMQAEQIGKTDKELVVFYASLVKRIAHHLLGRLPPSVQPDDLIQAGMIGLLEAAKNYDAAKGASFETYAGIRIRGSMLDEIRKGDWVPRSVHRNARRVAEIIRALEHESGGNVRDVDVAKALEVELDKYYEILRDISCCRMIGIEDLPVNEDMISPSNGAKFNEPLERLQDENFKHHLVEYIAGLPERERLVLALYYDEELNLREIGEVLNVTESRVCQIHSQALVRLQAKMQDWVN